jgi:hypothetical protein
VSAYRVSGAGRRARLDELVKGDPDRTDRRTVRYPYADKHPFRYALTGGLLFFALTWGFLHFPLWFGVVSGIGMVGALWTGYRRGGWARRIFGVDDPPPSN